MKYIGAAVMPAFLSLYSVMFSLRLRKRAEILDKTYSLLNEIKILMEYCCLPVNELIDTVFEKDCYQRTFISQCKKQLSEGDDFPVAWSDAVKCSDIYKKEEKNKWVLKNKSFRQRMPGKKSGFRRRFQKSWLIFWLHWQLA